MYYARNIAEDRQQDVYPELITKPHLQEHSQGWKKDRNQDSPEIHL